MTAGRLFRLAVLLGVFGAVAGVALAGQGEVSWGRAIPVPGIAKLNTAGLSWTTSVSCPTAGNCAAGGNYYTGGGYQFRAFVVGEKAGAWGKAIEVPGMDALEPASGYAFVTSVSCGSAGNCVAGGYYSDSSQRQQAFLADEKDGVWGTATGVPGMDAMNTGGFAWIRSVSCTSAGNCTAGGDYAPGSTRSLEGFVVDERNGVWGNPVALPSMGVDYVSCASPGNCVVSGEGDTGSRLVPFLLTERHGTWGTPVKATGVAARNAGRLSAVNSISCSGAGSCAAGGFYRDGGFHDHAFVMLEHDGVWGKAIEVPGMPALDHGEAEVTSVFCTRVAYCVAGGNFTDRFGNEQPFVVAEEDGVWGTAIRLPFALDRGPASAYLSSVSCANAGNCAAVGGFSNFAQGAFVAAERDGHWGRARRLPGTGNQAEANSVSCARWGAARCAVGGGLNGAGSPADPAQAFVTNH